MRLSFADVRVLAVVAHPDDAELLCAGTLARAGEDGAEVGICVLCRGDKGQPARRIPNLAAVRRQEMTASARLLGAQLFTLGSADGTLADAERPRRRLVEVYRAFRPTLVLAHAPEDYHADHRAASVLAEAVSWSSASRGLETRLAPLEAPPILWWMDCIGLGSFQPGFFIDVSAQVEIKERMLACHQSQLQRGSDRDFAPLLELMRQQTQARGLQAGVPAAEAFRLHLAFKRVPAW